MARRWITTSDVILSSHGEDLKEGYGLNPFKSAPFSLFLCVHHDLKFIQVRTTSILLWCGSPSSFREPEFDVPPSRRAVSNAPKGGDLLRRSRKTCHSARRRSIRPPRDRTHLFSHREPDGGASPESPLFLCGFFTVVVLETTRAYL